ncbi:hypothetical protein O181_038458 [Austropuccinia psidii MF-1]|uniref:Reverse transcriptase Ty1/copia-type domain-containing protein n=1 Tax=Austropuccinia psidii MF-1 TaxID=1389203 RepID=A0A9Q3HB14_9BASI|nr:hypothetical protein [Austropuccinia psidii MF-1]
MENWHNRKINKFVSDRGETPEHNGYAKRANLTVLVKACCLMNQREQIASLTLDQYSCQADQNLTIWMSGSDSESQKTMGLEAGLTWPGRNVILNEKNFPAVANGKTSPLWNIEASESDTELIYTQNSPAASGHLEPSDQQHSENYIWLRVIGPPHPTLINSDVDPPHILPFSRRARVFVTTSNIVPRTYWLAIQCKDKTKWMTEIERELSATSKMKEWDIVELKGDYKLVGTTWVFKVKKDNLHHTVEHKAHLCMQGFTQTPGVDFEKTYAPTRRLNSLRCLIAHS